MNRLEQLLALYEQNPDDSFVLFALGKEYEQLGQDAEAERWYRRRAETDPDYLGLWYHLAALVARTGRKDEALALYDEGIRRARAAGDQHTLSELQNARMNLEIE